MKNILFIGIIFLNCNSLLASIRVSGQILTEENYSVFIGEESHLELSPNLLMIKLDRNNFFYESNTKKATLITIKLQESLDEQNNLGKTFFWAFPGDSIHLGIRIVGHDQDKYEIEFSGNNASGHNFLAPFMNAPLYNNYYPLLQAFSEAEDVDEAYQEYENHLTGYLRILDKALSEKQITFPYYKLADLTVRTLLVYGVTKVFFREKDYATNAISHLEKQVGILQKLMIGIPNLSDYPVLNDYLFHMVAYLKVAESFLTSPAELKRENLFKDTIVLLEGDVYNLKGVFASTFYFTDTQLQEFYLASCLNQVFQTMIGMTENYKKEFDFFNRKFPQSRYQEVLSMAINENGRYYDSESSYFPISIEDSSEIQAYSYWTPIIIDETGSIVGINHVNLVEGVFYVNLWATWCAPCLQSFNYNYRVDSLLDHYNASRLYISIDDHLTAFSTWNETIYNKSLGGYHILAGEQLIAYLRQELHLSSSSLVIPRYFWLKNGKVIDHNAASPNDYDKIKKQLQNLLENEK